MSVKRTTLAWGQGALLLALTAIGCSQQAAPDPHATTGHASASRPAVGPARPAAPTEATPRPTTTPRNVLRVFELALAGAAGRRDDASFCRGESLLLLFSVKGLRRTRGKPQLHATLSLHRPEGGLMQKTAPIPLEPQAPESAASPLTYLRLAAPLSLDPALLSGHYRLQVTLRDPEGPAEATASTSLTLDAPAPPPASKLTIALLGAASGLRQPAGSVLPLHFVAAGITNQRSQGHYRSRLWVSAELRQGTHTVASSRRQWLPSPQRPFAPASFAARYDLPLPSNLAPGRYEARLRLHDDYAAHSAEASLPFEVIPTTFSLVTLHTHDAAHLPRRTFRLGERVLVRLGIAGFRANGAGEANIAGDLAIAGPGGVYFAQKAAYGAQGVASRPWAKAKRYAAEVPLLLPTLAPPGRYRIVLRAHDLLAKKTSTRELTLELYGKAPKRRARFEIDRLEVRLRPDLDPLPGHTFAPGQRYHLLLQAGGGKLKEVARSTYHAKLEASLRLLDLKGKELARWDRLFQLDRRLHYQPLRLRVQGYWTPPAALAAGLYDLELVAVEQLSERVSTLRRRIELKGGR